MSYNSESINEMFSTLKQYGYGYTEYSHKNGKCSINTDILLKAMKKQIEEEGMHFVKLFIPISDFFIEKLVYINAPDYIIKQICDEIERDGLLEDAKKINAVLDILKARGYKYKIVDDIPQFRV